MTIYMILPQITFTTLATLESVSIIAKLNLSALKCGIMLLEHEFDLAAKTLHLIRI